MKLPAAITVVLATAFVTLWVTLALPAGTGHSCGDFACDEPAVHTPAPSYWVAEGCDPGANVCSNDTMICANNGHPAPDNNAGSFLSSKCVDGWTWTCADKSRILLSAEDGKQWCYKPHINQ
jgi:hypothetical protein